MLASQSTARERGGAADGGSGSDKREWSGRRDSNPRPTAWKAVTLPLSYSRWEQIWWRRMDSNHRRAWPSRFTVCPLWPLGYASKELSSFLLLSRRILEPAPGIEPGTYCLQDSSSTAELCRRCPCKLFRAGPYSRSRESLAAGGLPGKGSAGERNAAGRTRRASLAFRIRVSSRRKRSPAASGA
jgi:hypothetical protein